MDSEGKDKRKIGEGGLQKYCSQFQLNVLAYNIN
jgi:hypothetical protein